MAIRGERFELKLSSESDEEDQASSSGQPSNPPNTFSFGLIGDIKERNPSSAPQPPSAPSSTKTSGSGFPAHKKRAPVSRFKSGSREARGDGPAFQASGPSAPEKEARELVSERANIDRENKERLAAMSEEEIARERAELLEGLDPSLLQKLLKRANIDDNPSRSRGPQESTAGSIEHQPRSLSSDFKQIETEPEDSTRPSLNHPYPDATASPSIPPSQHQLNSEDLPPPPPQIPSIHFPTPPLPPSDLDPSSVDFLADLHTKYFPNLPTDPSKLAWMSPLPSENSLADTESPYSPTQESLPPSSLRFDFRGALLPPRTARAIPVTAGLHHHGEAPEAAGYTVPELARLARSAFPAQRCVAFQTLGRILYRLGTGRFGDEGSVLVMGLWRCVEEGKVLDVLQREAAMTEGHVSAKAYATEAVWNWQRGGGKKWKAQ
ncbi:MAG: hypothetical protein M1817_004233 [Caeruleum heppii]|nr:MAG: hypothetical protein M1817_004233 [Caeruleum heppii]